MEKAVTLNLSVFTEEELHDFHRVAGMGHWEGDSFTQGKGQQKRVEEFIDTMEKKYGEQLFNSHK